MGRFRLSLSPTAKTDGAIWQVLRLQARSVCYFCDINFTWYFLKSFFIILDTLSSHLMDAAPAVVLKFMTQHTWRWFFCTRIKSIFELYGFRFKSSPKSYWREFSSESVWWILAVKFGIFTDVKFWPIFSAAKWVLSTKRLNPTIQLMEQLFRTAQKPITR